MRWVDLEARGRAAGLDVLAATTAEPFDDARAVLEERRAAGLHGSMQFTYRKPERSTDPGRTLPGVRTLVVGATLATTGRRRRGPRAPGPSPGWPATSGPTTSTRAARRAPGRRATR